jgi:hypothetical protein
MRARGSGFQQVWRTQPGNRIIPEPGSWSHGPGPGNHNAIVLPQVVRVHGAIGSSRWIAQTRRCRCPRFLDADLVPVAGDQVWTSPIVAWASNGIARAPRSLKSCVAAGPSSAPGSTDTSVPISVLRTSRKCSSRSRNTACSRRTIIVSRPDGIALQSKTVIGIEGRCRRTLPIGCPARIHCRGRLHQQPGQGTASCQIGRSNRPSEGSGTLRE